MSRAKLGQHFLRNKSVLNKIVLASNIKPSDIILEIGPGKGALTTKLAPLAKQVIAVEKDWQLVQTLKRKFAKNANVKIIHNDILQIDLKNIKKQTKIIGNIPYYITGKIIKKFAGFFMVLMVQREVAKKITAQKLSILSLSIKKYGLPQLICNIKKTAFSPQPKVNSGVIKIIPRKKPLNINLKLAKKAFANQRKQIKNTLPIKLLKKAKINPQKRPENLTLKQWECLSKLAQKK